MVLDHPTSITYEGKRRLRIKSSEFFDSADTPTHQQLAQADDEAGAGHIRFLISGAGSI